MSPRFVVRQEPDRLAQRKLVVTTIAAIVVFGSAVAVSGFMLDASRAGRDLGPPAASVAPITIGTVEQGLLVGPPRGLDVRRDQRATLDRWEWVDRDAGFARIPVERAMDIIAAGDGGTR